MTNLSPTPGFQPCLPSLERWELYCVSVHNTVSTASALDWFTASLACCRHTGWLNCSRPIYHQYTTAQSADDSFSLMSLSKLQTEERSGIGSLMIRPCSRRLAEQRFIVYSECCKLCLGFPSQTEACRFCFVVTAKPQENRKDHCGKLAS